MANVFISYSHADLLRCEQIAAQIRRRGFSIWRDTGLRSGERIPDALERELRSAGCVLVLWSKAAAASEWVNREAAYALNAKKLVSISLDGTRPAPPFDDILTPTVTHAGSQQPMWDGIFNRLAPFGLGAPYRRRHHPIDMVVVPTGAYVIPVGSRGKRLEDVREIEVGVNVPFAVAKRPLTEDEKMFENIRRPNSPLVDARAFGRPPCVYRLLSCKEWHLVNALARRLDIADIGPNFPETIALRDEHRVDTMERAVELNFDPWPDRRGDWGNQVVRVRLALTLPEVDDKSHGRGNDRR